MRKFCSCYISDIALIGSKVDLQMEIKFAMQHLTTMMTQGFKLIAVRQNLLSVELHIVIHVILRLGGAAHIMIHVLLTQPRTICTLLGKTTMQWQN